MIFFFCVLIPTTLTQSYCSIIHTAEERLSVFCFKSFLLFYLQYSPSSVEALLMNLFPFPSNPKIMTTTVESDTLSYKTAFRKEDDTIGRKASTWDWNGMDGIGWHGPKDKPEVSTTSV